MAKGEGGGGHYDERRRSNVRSAYADSDEVIAEILKPRKKPPAPKKKAAVAIPRAKPSRVKVESHSGDVPEMYIPQDELARRARPALAPTLRMGALQAERRMRPPVSTVQTDSDPGNIQRSNVAAKGDQLASPWERISSWNPLDAGRRLLSQVQGRTRTNDARRLDQALLDIQKIKRKGLGIWAKD